MGQLLTPNVLYTRASIFLDFILKKSHKTVDGIVLIKYDEHTRRNGEMLMRKIGIIGLGHVGSTVAHGLIAEGVADEYVFIDKNEGKVQAEALDFEDAKTNLANSYQITVNDYAALGDADVVISALGNIELQHNNPTHDRFVELSYNVEQVRQVAADLKQTDFSGVLVVITNPCDAIAALYQAETGYP